MTRIRSLILLSIPLLALVTIGFLIANQQAEDAGWMLGAYVSLGLLVVAGLLLAERPDVLVSIHTQEPEPSTDDLLRVISDPAEPIPHSKLPPSEVFSTERAEAPAPALDQLDPFSLVEEPDSTIEDQPDPVIPTPEQLAAVDSKVAEIFVNLGRRNKQLNRQMLTLISHLERDELDPEILQGLYELDHLATRMRRNEETLLMLANPRKVRQWSQPVKAENLLRSALAEVERFARVEIDDIPDVEILGSAVADVTHLLAEVIDNATEFSHTSTVVTVSANTTLEGLEIEVLDSGHGIDDLKMAELNALLADPPPLGEAPSRRLGLFIAARFANCQEVDVSLTGERGVGTVATISLPNALLVEDEHEESSLEALDLVDPVHVLAIGSELEEAQEEELADAALPTREEVAEAFPVTPVFPTISSPIGESSEPHTLVEPELTSFPSVAGVLPESDLVLGVAPLPSRIPQATFESVWGTEEPSSMPDPQVAQFLTGDAVEYDDVDARETAQSAASAISAFTTGVARGLDDTVDEPVPRFLTEGDST